MYINEIIKSNNNPFFSEMEYETSGGKVISAVKNFKVPNMNTLR